MRNSVTARARERGRRPRGRPGAEAYSRVIGPWCYTVCGVPRGGTSPVRRGRGRGRGAAHLGHLGHLGQPRAPRAPRAPRKERRRGRRGLTYQAAVALVAVLTAACGATGGQLTPVGCQNS